MAVCIRKMTRRRRSERTESAPGSGGQCGLDLSKVGLLLHRPLAGPCLPQYVSTHTIQMCWPRDPPRRVAPAVGSCRQSAAPASPAARSTKPAQFRHSDTVRNDRSSIFWRRRRRLVWSALDRQQSCARATRQRESELRFEQSNLQRSGVHQLHRLAGKVKSAARLAASTRCPALS